MEISIGIVLDTSMIKLESDMGNYTFLVDDSGNYLIDDSGNYLVE